MSSVGSITSNDYFNSLVSSVSETEVTEDDGSTIDQTEFLELLMTQLQYQDPLDPMDSDQFTAQLTDFSMLEQQVEMNEQLTDINDTLGTSTQYGIMEYIGKEVVTTSNVINVNDENITNVTVSMEEAGNVQMIVFDSDGEEVTRIDCGDLSAGTHDITWDGTDSDGNRVENGDYAYLVSAIDENGASIDVGTAEFAEVTGIYYDSGSPYLLVGDSVVSLDNIVEIRG